MRLGIHLICHDTLHIFMSAAAGSECGCLTVVLQQRKELELLELGQQTQLLHTC